MDLLTSILQEPYSLTLFIIIVLLIVSGLKGAIKIVPEYERLVVFRLGRLVEGYNNPGICFIIPFGIDKAFRIDLRTLTLEIPPQEIITKDNVTVKVTAVAYFRVVNPREAITKIKDYVFATSQISQTTLRSVIGQAELDDLLARREKINEALQKIIDSQTEPWGVKVSIVEVKDVELPELMKRAMAKQAESERERRAKVIHAEGEYEAAGKLAEAAEIITQTPTAIQLRYLQTLAALGTERSSIILFPLPLDLIRGIFSKEEVREDKSPSTSG